MEVVEEVSDPPMTPIRIWCHFEAMPQSTILRVTQISFSFSHDEKKKLFTKMNFYKPYGIIITS